jgi:hypothetical protein
MERAFSPYFRGFSATAWKRHPQKLRQTRCKSAFPDCDSDAPMQGNPRERVEKPEKWGFLPQ